MNNIENLRDMLAKSLEEVEKSLRRAKRFMPAEGQPCEHPGCLSHVTHPCECCGRIAGRGPIVVKHKEQPE